MRDKQVLRGVLSYSFTLLSYHCEHDKLEHTTSLPADPKNPIEFNYSDIALQLVPSLTMTAKDADVRRIATRI